MDQFEFLTRDQLISLVRSLGTRREAGRGAAPGYSEDLPVFTEHALRDFESNASPMRIFDHETLKYRAVNDAAVKFYGYSREEFLELSLKDTRHPDEHAEQIASFAESAGYFRYGKPRRQHRKSGEVVVVEVVTQDILFNGRAARLALTIDLTGRLRTQELLWQRQQEFESLAENLPDIVVRFDRDIRHIYVNAALEKVTGMSRAEFLGKTHRELPLPPDLAARFDRSMREVFETGRPNRLEFSLSTPNGERHFDAQHIPERDESGQVRTALCVARDVTERTRIERALRETNEFLQSVIECSRDCIKVLDLEGRLQLMNESGRRLLEIDNLAPLFGIDWAEFWRGPYLEAARAALDTAKSGGVGSFEGYCPTRKGTPKWWDVVITPILDAAGRPARLLAVSREITRRMKAQEIHSRLAAIVDQSLDAIISQDLDGTIRTWNPAAERLFGYSADEAVGRSVIMLIPPEREQEAALVEERISNGVPVDGFESVRVRKDGKRVDVAVSISPIKDSAGKVIGASRITHDITERRQTELAVLRSAALSRLVESLARAANEAGTPEAAMDACLKLICRHGRWVLGRAEIFERGQSRNMPGRSVWYSPQADRFDEFIRISETRARKGNGGFNARVLRDQTAVWVEDWRDIAGGRRWESGTRHGLKSAFAFPVIAGGEVAAIMEVFSEDSRPQDPHLMGAAHSLASHLARIVEREWAHRTNERIAAIVESSRDAIFSRSLDGTILTWNSGAEQLFGYTAAEIVGRSVELLFPPELKQDQQDLLHRQEPLLRGHAIQPHETERVAKDGRRIHVSVSPAALRDAGGKVNGVSIIMRDITERKRIEFAIRRGEELARLHASLAHAASEATTPETAMLACLARICSFGNWAFGRVALYEASSSADGLKPRSIWHTPDREKFSQYIEFSDGWTYKKTGPFIGRVFRERAAIWIEDLQKEMAFGRREAAIRHGIRSGLAFPIIVHGEVVATMEAYSETARPEDPLTMSAVQSLASQLARIVERERAHRADARMATIVESSQDAIISRGLDGTILTWNAGAEKLFGYTAAEAIGRNIELMVPPELVDGMRPRTALLLQGQTVPQRETVRLAKDGRRIPVSTNPAAIRDSNGAICGISTIIRDMTARILAEQALRESEERFRQLAENIDQVFWINAPAGDRMVYVSPAYERVWGRSRESLYRDPRSWMDPIYRDDLPAVMACQRKMARGEHTDVEYRIIRPDGTIRWIKDRSYQIRQGDGTPLVCGIAEDITDARLAEERRLTQALHQRDALVREVHHRIKNNLQGVAGLLRQKIRKFPAAAPGIEEAIAQLQAVATIYGLQGTRADGWLGLADLIEAICASVEGLMGGRIDRIFKRQSVRPACLAGTDAVSVAVALNELIFNALKHQSASPGHKRAQIVLCESQEAAEIVITNRGRLLKQFDFAADRGVGTGLGLVKTLLASPGATVAYSSGRNKVTVSLKLRPPMLAERRGGNLRRGKNGSAGSDQAAAAHPGRG